jgi:hypothetical protein
MNPSLLMTHFLKTYCLSTTQPLKRIATIAFVVTLMLMSTAALLRAEDGAGTKFFKCRDTAHSTYATCKSHAEGFWEKAECWAAWEFDLLGCDAQLLRDLKPF